MRTTKRVLATLAGLAMAMVFATVAGCGDVDEVTVTESAVTTTSCIPRGLPPIPGGTHADNSLATWVPYGTFPAGGATVSASTSTMTRNRLSGTTTPVTCSAFFEIYTDPNMSCKTYYRSVGGSCVWQNNVNKPLNDWALKFVRGGTGAAGFQERHDLVAPTGETVLIRGDF